MNQSSFSILGYMLQSQDDFLRHDYESFNNLHLLFNKSGIKTTCNLIEVLSSVMSDLLISAIPIMSQLQEPVSVDDLKIIFDYCKKWYFNNLDFFKKSLYQWYSSDSFSMDNDYELYEIYINSIYEI